MRSRKEIAMPKKFASIAVLALLPAAIAVAAQFEGVATYKITTSGGPGKTIEGTSKIFVTKTAYRMEMETDFAVAFGRRQSAASAASRHVKVTMIGKVSEPEKMIILNEQDRTYSTWDFNKMRRRAQPPTFTVKKLGSDRVAGIACEKALLNSSNGSEVEVCVAKDLAVSSEWFVAMARHQRQTIAWMEALKNAGLEGFPVRYALRRDQETLSTMELTNLDRTAPSASLFEIPAGYKETHFAIPGMTSDQRREMFREHLGERLGTMTPEQRKAFEDSMKRHGGWTPPPEPTEKP
jgi:hypothetical protein